MDGGDGGTRARQPKIKRSYQVKYVLMNMFETNTHWVGFVLLGHFILKLMH